jgi:hypothetical protein
MQEDAVDRIIRAWRIRIPRSTRARSKSWARLLLCSHHLRTELRAALEPLGLSFGDFDVINTLRRRGDVQGTNPRGLAASALVTRGRDDGVSTGSNAPG